MAKLELGREEQLPKHWTGTASRRTRRRDKGRGRRKVAPPTHSWSLSLWVFKVYRLETACEVPVVMMGIEGGDRRQRYVGRVGQAGTVSNHMTTRFSRISNVCLFSSHLTRQVKKSTSNWRRWHCPLNRLLSRGTWYHFARHRRSSLHPSHKGSKSLVGPTAANRLEVAYLYYKINKCSPKKKLYLCASSSSI